MLNKNPHSITLSEENPSNKQKLIDKIISMTEKITNTDGYTETIIPFLIICRHNYETPVVQGVLSPSFCLVLQGRKEVYLGENIFQANPGDYLASVVDIPASARVTGCTNKSPYIGIRISFTMEEITSVMLEADISVDKRDDKLIFGTCIGKSDTDFLELFVRLLKLVDAPSKAKFLSKLIKREMIFHLLSGEYRHLFLQQVFFDQQSDGVGKALAWIKENYTHSFTIEELAKSFNMSVSGLQHKFKAITSLSPVQYQKKLRLQEARRLMLSGSMDATTAALEVGYESPSQFSREYRRCFGMPPLRDIKNAQKNYTKADLESFLKGLNNFQKNT